MSIPLIALKPHRYDGRLWRKGQTILARSADDALVLTTLGVAVAANVPQPSQVAADAPIKRPRGRPRKNTYETRALVEDDLETTAVVVEKMPALIEGDQAAIVPSDWTDARESFDPPSDEE